MRSAQEAIVTEHSRRRVRAGLVYLSALFLVVGLWATLAPSSFYDGFPGGGRHWVAGDGSYNAHLVGDAGVGFLAVGLVVLLAAVWMDIRVIQAASGAVMVHDGPHLLFHLRHPNEALGSLDTWLSNGGLAFGMLIALVILVAVSRAGANADILGAARAGVPAPRTSPEKPRDQLSWATPIKKEES